MAVDVDLPENSPGGTPRVVVVQRLVDNLLPLNVVENLAKKKVEIPKSDWDDEIQGWYESEVKRGIDAGKDLQDVLVSNRKVSVEGLPNYLNDIVALTQLIQQPGKDPKIEDVTDVAVKCRQGKEYSDLFLKLAHEWREEFPECDKKTQYSFQNPITLFYDLMNRTTRTSIYISSGDESVHPDVSTLADINEAFTIYVNLQKLKNKATDELFPFYEANIKHLVESDLIGQAKLYQEQFKEEYKVMTRDELDLIYNYCRNNPVDAVAMGRLNNNLLPTMRGSDPEYQLLRRAGNLWFMDRSGYGAADYLVHSAIAEYAPSELSELLLASKQIPTSEFRKLEQNRKDALALMPAFGALRDFIHDQRPGVHEAVAAMVTYYDTNDNTALLASSAVNRDYLKSDSRTSVLLDKANYGIKIEALVEGVKREEKAIDVLRRVEENSRPVSIEPPLTRDGKLNKSLQDLDSMIVGSDEALTYLGTAVDYVIGYVEQNSQTMTVGVSPEFMRALAWVDHRAAKNLQSLSYEQQVRVYKEPWFASVVKLSDWLYSGGKVAPDKSETDDFVSDLQAQTDFRLAYRMVGQRVAEHVDELALSLKDHGKTSLVEMIWSGNMARELLGMNDFKEPKTEYGKKHRREMDVREDEKVVSE